MYFVAEICFTIRCCFRPGWEFYIWYYLPKILKILYFEMHLALPVSDKRPQDVTRASPLPKLSHVKKIIKYLFNYFIQGYDESLLYQGPKIFHSEQRSISKWLPISKSTLRLSDIFRNLNFISLSGRITVQPKPQSWHLPLDYSLVLSAIRVEWMNNEKQLTLLFISSSIVLLVIWLTSPFISMRHSSEQWA